MQDSTKFTILKSLLQNALAQIAKDDDLKMFKPRLTSVCRYKSTKRLPLSRSRVWRNY
jgi:hypothetical protein